MSKTEHEECVATGKTSNENVNEVCNDTTTEKVVGIYGLRNKVNGKWYVGQSVDVIGRWKKYAHKQCRRQPKIYNALNKHGYDSFEKVVLEECESVDWILAYREMYWIRHLNAFVDGYNLTEGGLGVRHTNATREKIRRASSSHTHTDETRQKISWSKMGKSLPAFTIDHRKNMSKAIKKAHWSKGKAAEQVREKLRLAWVERRKKGTSEETRKKISAATTGMRRTISQRKTMSLAQKKSAHRRGVLHTEETKKKMSMSHKRRSQHSLRISFG